MDRDLIDEPEYDTHDLGTGYEPDDPKGWVVSGEYPDFDLIRDMERGK